MPYMNDSVRDTASEGSASSVAAGRQETERRFDPACPNGNSYTKEQFILAYGGTDQWHACLAEKPPQKRRRMPSLAARLAAQAEFESGRPSLKHGLKTQKASVLFVETPVPSPSSLTDDPRESTELYVSDEESDVYSTREGWAVKMYEDDPRCCALCHEKGDRRDTGRLLSASVGVWVHSNCAAWSAEVHESTDAHLQSVHNAISRGSNLVCSFCDRRGATIGCCKRGCPANYHFTCAIKARCFLLAGRTTFCAVHKIAAAYLAKAASLKVLVDKEFERPSHAVKIAKRPQDLAKENDAAEATALGARRHGIRLGSLTLLRLGRIIFGAQHFHTESCIYPVGYRVCRRYWTDKIGSVRCRCDWILEVLAGEVRQMHHPRAGWSNHFQ